MLALNSEVFWLARESWYLSSSGAGLPPLSVMCWWFRI